MNMRDYQTLHTDKSPTGSSTTYIKMSVKHPLACSRVVLFKYEKSPRNGNLNLLVRIKFLKKKWKKIEKFTGPKKYYGSWARGPVLIVRTATYLKMSVKQLLACSWVVLFGMKCKWPYVISHYRYKSRRREPLRNGSTVSLILYW
jgi:hypothetical protein